MVRRRILRAGIAIALVAVSIFGSGAPASASPSSFVAKAVHANGAGALGVEAVGGITWYNRSVMLTDVRFFANAGESGNVAFHGYQGTPNTFDPPLIDYVFYPGDGTYYHSGLTGTWFPIGDVLLDGSAVSGGITMVIIYITDHTHNIAQEVICYRFYASCYVN